MLEYWSFGVLGVRWGGEFKLNLHLQSHPVFILMTSQVIIWDFRLRIADCGFVESLRSINYNGPFDTQAHDRPFEIRYSAVRCFKPTCPDYVNRLINMLQSKCKCLQPLYSSDRLKAFNDLHTMVGARK
jgi:hypothetical protein